MEKQPTTTLYYGHESDDTPLLSVHPPLTQDELSPVNLSYPEATLTDLFVEERNQTETFVSVPLEVHEDPKEAIAIRNRRVRHIVWLINHVRGGRSSLVRVSKLR